MTATVRHAAVFPIVALAACNSRVLDVQSGAPARVEGRRTLVVAGGMGRARLRRAAPRRSP